MWISQDSPLNDCDFKSVPLASKRLTVLSPAIFALTCKTFSDTENLTIEATRILWAIIVFSEDELIAEISIRLDELATTEELERFAELLDSFTAERTLDDDTSTLEEDLAELDDDFAELDEVFNELDEDLAELDEDFAELDEDTGETRFPRVLNSAWSSTILIS